MKAYRILAFTIAALVVVQAGAVAWGFFGTSNWIEEGGVVDKAYLESSDGGEFIAEWGFMLHMFLVGTVLIPLTSLILLITSFFAKVPQGIAMAAGIFGLIALQVIVLPMLAREVGSGFGALHGVNALVLMGVAIMAGQRASAAMGTTAKPGTDTTTPVPA